jgi:hypothetical protein
MDIHTPIEEKIILILVNTVNYKKYDKYSKFIHII